MSKISVSVGMNIPISKENRFDRFVPSVSISDIDTNSSISIEEQIKEALSAGEKVWNVVTSWLEESIAKELGE